MTGASQYRAWRGWYLARADWDAISHDPFILIAHRLRHRDLEQSHRVRQKRDSVAGDDLDSPLIVPLIKRAATRLHLTWLMIRNFQRPRRRDLRVRG